MVNSAACSVRQGARCFLVPPECAPPEKFSPDVTGKTWQIVVLVNPVQVAAAATTAQLSAVQSGFAVPKGTSERGFVVSLQASKVICAWGTRVRMPFRELLVKFDGLAL